MNGVVESMVALLPDPEDAEPAAVQAWINAFAAVLELVYRVDVVPVTVRSRPSIARSATPATVNDPLTLTPPPAASNGSSPPPVAPPAARCGARRRRRSYSVEQKQAGAALGREIGKAAASRRLEVHATQIKAWMVQYPAMPDEGRPKPMARRLADAQPAMAQPSDQSGVHQFPEAGPIERRPIDQDAARARAGQAL